ncbi:MAG: Rhodanese domain protein [Myxococcaceae bacterium]|nr:Rhodanese domain protein [Myxococcaceae bacterium]
MRRRWKMAGGLALALGALAACSRPAATTQGAAPTHAGASSEAELRPMTVAELAAMIERGDQVAVVDNNSPESYARGHIPGARWAAHDGITAQMLPQDRNARVVFYCHNEH